MTLAEIELLDCDFLTVAQVASCLHADPQVIRDQSQREPKYLGFNISQFGHSFRIPRLAFIAWMKGQIPIVAYQGCYTGYGADK